MMLDKDVTCLDICDTKLRRILMNIFRFADDVISVRKVNKNKTTEGLSVELCFVRETIGRDNWKRRNETIKKIYKLLLTVFSFDLNLVSEFVDTCVSLQSHMYMLR